jgi:hypothetical protein
VSGGLIRRLIRDGIIDPAAVFGRGSSMPSAVLERLREEAILEGMVSHVHFIPCNTKVHADREPHEAHYWMRCPCHGPAWSVCAERRAEVEAVGGLKCNPTTCRCDAFHRSADLLWTRI